MTAQRAVWGRLGSATPNVEERSSRFDQFKLFCKRFSIVIVQSRSRGSFHGKCFLRLFWRVNKWPNLYQTVANPSNDYSLSFVLFNLELFGLNCNNFMNAIRKSR